MNSSTPPPITLAPVGIIQAPFPEKFGVPRQSGLAPHAIGSVALLPPYAVADAVRGLEAFSHLWLLTWFHQAQRAAEAWSPTVRPPRLGGNQRIGVFASRAPFRPNPLGLSVVRLLRVEVHAQGVRLHVGGLDMVDGTPVLDIKPYIRYADSIPDADSSWADTPPDRLAVHWSAVALQQAARLSEAQRALIQEVVALDPRPAYQDDARSYGIQVEGCNVRCRFDGADAWIDSLTGPP